MEAVYDLVVIGAGAGGCFAAIRLAELKPGVRICVLEAARKPLGKVEISGGGRCNVTHACFDPGKLATYYPRGADKLIEPFNVFQPRDMMNWLDQKGVRLKAEEDGRVFPVTDKSETIINCFLQSMDQRGIQLWTSTRAIKCSQEASTGNWTIHTKDGHILRSRFLLISTGSDERIWKLLHELGHTIVPPVPSLFTFQIRDESLHALSGISIPEAGLQINNGPLEAFGPLLITHWGLSGPAVLRLSAWGARELNEMKYVFDLKVNWCNRLEFGQLFSALWTMADRDPRKKVHNFSMADIPARLWKYLCLRAGIHEIVSGSQVGKKALEKLARILVSDVYQVTGKSTYKKEFVTAGGVELEEVDLTRFESKRIPGLFLVGEVLNIDALTGGFNFQAAWTGAELVARAIAKRSDQ